MLTAVAVAACAVATALAALRWLRVAQREHYLVGSCTRFARRWWFGLPFNVVLAVGALVNLLLTAASPRFAFLVAAPVAVGPLGLRLRGTAPGPIVWTRRLRTLAAIGAGLALVVLVAGWLARVPAVAAALVAVATPAIVDLALRVAEPIEASSARGFVETATKKLRSVGPTVVAITGSYGKTSTKGYVAHLASASRTVVASPASFNNQAGLSRTVNEHLAPGTEVLVAEMGTYGPGEIAAMCEWVRPSVAAITAIGPVHLERMKDEATIARAKSEIFSTATTCVLNVDDEWLAPMVDGLRAAGKTVVRCSATDTGADVSVVDEDGVRVARVAGAELARIGPTDAAATNVAIAIALARAVGVPDEVIARRLPDLPTAANRRTIETGPTGATFIDDTYNSNPAGAAAALATLERLADEGNPERVVLVTPGMVEMGDRQEEENRRLAAAAGQRCTDVVVIGATNARALVGGAGSGRARIHRVRDREGARAWVRENAVAGDVVLFENDLPDHYP